jgi:hypothetical protein
MMMRKGASTLLACGWLAAAVFFAAGSVEPVYAQQDEPVQVSVSVEPETVAIGDTVRYRISISAPKEYALELPDFQDDLGGFAIKDFGSEQKIRWGKQYIEKWFLLDTYVSGTYEIPSAIIKYTEPGSDLSEEVTVEAREVVVESVLEGTTGQTDIYDIKSVRSFPSRWGLLLAVVLAVVFVVAAIAAFFITRSKITGEPIIPLPPAHELAYRALDELERKDLPSAGRIKDFFSELSLIIRHYVENRFEIRAPEMTTEEFLESLRSAEELSREHKQVLRDFLEQSDMVKFARYGPVPAEIAANFDAARRFVDETRADNFTGGSDRRYEL